MERIMLTDKEIVEIKEHLKHYPRKQAAVIEALKVVQEHRGYVSDESVKDVAEFLEMTPDEVDSVATFYNLIFRKPVGEHVILLCDSISCWIMGYENVRDHLKDKLKIDLGQTTEDKKFTLLTIPCLGACDRAPAMMVDNELYGNLTPEKIDEILDQYK
ncbi:NADH dehydrogenase subunit E [Caldithrix abyssi DSM 13497]|uniref:NADH dehydrogenase subunit E n=2 Tax=Caldithrix abyssi DSM 13497 TaxID=880073 RepID=A0A1J1CE05_CALAY|nr:NADH-quinone oxidoreductase subunit NuoE [Caldithrix abyssi]APF20798.1 NADH dehydrogenase subunit E [Caldithrix abyssi DSM 13497]